MGWDECEDVHKEGLAEGRGCGRRGCGGAGLRRGGAAEGPKVKEGVCRALSEGVC